MISILGRREDRLITSSKAIEKAAKEAKKDVIVLYCITDITSKANVEESFESIAAEVGPLHILVSNAGVFPGIAKLAADSVGPLMSGFETNGRGALTAVQAFLPLSASAPDGNATTILNFATGTHMALIPSSGLYMVSKVANHKMMDFIAAENPHIHVVNVSLGVTLTEMSEPNKDAVSHWDSRKCPLHLLQLGGCP